MGIESTTFLRSSQYPVAWSNSTDHLVLLCKKFEATHYLTGDAARNYLDYSAFEREGITVEFQEFVHPEYPQMWTEKFISHLSIIDLLCNAGPGSLGIVRGMVPGGINDNFLRRTS